MYRRRGGVSKRSSHGPGALKRVSVQEFKEEKENEGLSLKCKSPNGSQTVDLKFGDIPTPLPKG